MLNKPPPWSSTTEFPPKNCSPANATVPSAIATTGVPAGRSTSTPAWGGAGPAVDDPAGAEPLRPDLRHRGEKREPPRGGGGDPGKTLFQPSGFPVDPFQCLAVELRHRLRQRELLNRKGSLPDRDLRVDPEHFASPHRPERKEGIARRFLEIDPDQTQELSPPFLPPRDLPPLPDHDDVVRPGRGDRFHEQRLPLGRLPGGQPDREGPIRRGCRQTLASKGGKRRNEEKKKKRNRPPHLFFPPSTTAPNAPSATRT